MKIIKAFALLLSLWQGSSASAASTYKSISSVTKFADIHGKKKLAYRSLGVGHPLILASRFRGDLDQWDPAFLDALAKNYRVITFDYSGIGLSTGKQATTHMEMAEDVRDLAKALDLKKFAVGGWSLGGFITQLVVTEFPDRVTHGILIATRPPGKNVGPCKPIFFDVALLPEFRLEDEIILFFNDKYQNSKEAAKRSRDRLALRKKDRDIPLTKPQWEQMLAAADFSNDTHGTERKLQNSKIPMLVIAGEDDLCFPVEDWVAKRSKLPTVQILILPTTGHGPQHQYPELVAQYIHAFIEGTEKQL